MSTDAPVLIENQADGVLLLTLNRPERHHALNRELHNRISEAVERAEADSDVRAIVITGSGDKAFCAGADMLEVSGVQPAQPSHAGEPGGLRLASQAIGHTPLPVIAAINGYCYGGGLRLAIECDLRLASENATFRIPGAEYGLVVVAATLPRLVGAARAKDLIFTARRFDAGEALDYGLVTAVYPPYALLPAALEMAREIAQHSPDAVREAKRVIDTATLSEDARALEEEVNRRLRSTPEQRERFRNATRRVTGQ